MDGEFKNFQCRTDVPEKIIRPWYRGGGTLLFNSNILQLVDYVFITEGPVDCILMNQCGFPCISTTGGSEGFQEKFFPYFIRQKLIYYLPDNDYAGYSGAKKVCKILGEHRVKIIAFQDEKPKFGFKNFILDGHTISEFKTKIDNSKYLFEIKKDLFNGRK